MTPVFSWHSRDDILSQHTSLCPSVSRKECQQTFAGPSKRWTFFIYNRQGIKEATLPTQSHLHTVFCCAHFTIWVSFILSFGEGPQILSSAPWPPCLISVIQLMRPGLWQAAGWDVPRDLSHPHHAALSDSAAELERRRSSTCNYLPLEIQHNFK